MKTCAIEIEGKVDELLDCLEKDIKHIQKSLSNLDELRSLVIKREDAALGKLLEKIRAESDIYKKHEMCRQSIRTELADYFECSRKDLTLSKLALSIPEAKRARINQSKSKLRVLIEKLRKEYSSTAMLLSECTRFNNLLLKSIFDLGKTGGLYYGADGTTSQQSETAFVNLQF